MDNDRIKRIKSTLAAVTELQAGLNERLADTESELARLTELRTDAEGAFEHLENVLIELQATVTEIVALTDDEVRNLDALGEKLDRATIRNLALNAGLDAVGQAIDTANQVASALKGPAA